MAENNKEFRIFGLDIVRAIAIIIVVISHSSGIFKLESVSPVSFHTSVPAETVATISADTKPETTATPGQATKTFNNPGPAEKQTHLRKGRVWTLGVLGVELFFVLSGFLIGNILIKQFLSAGKFSFRDIRSFLVRRWLRTLPDYWFVLTMVILISGDIRNFGWNTLEYYFFLQNFYTPHPQFFTEAWSLCVEEWFYLTVPFALLIASFVFKKAGKQKLLLFTFITYLSIVVIIRFVNSLHPVYGMDFDNGVRKVVMFRLDAIMYGVLVALLMRYRQAQIVKYKVHLLLLSAISSATIIWLMYYFEVGYIHSDSPFYVPFNAVLLYTLLPIAFSLCLPYASTLTTRRQAPNGFERGVTFISKISYSIYLSHNNIFQMFFLGVHAATRVKSVGLFLVYLASILLVSTLLYHFIEQPFLRLRDRKFRKATADVGKH